ncbi:alpha-N-acetylgalactosaminidase-like isoform X2 [Plodia interpunctella]|uniref:alpha-N-acetylgalactosaminidase-like isoform X2 n=1 Tax=Plodia interpunctella TaxID=58824 RepID=UPI0023688A82|nr:alpha-N-acetylgalactosaminidase-like isoform X2 [Plodia interpunctella]
MMVPILLVGAILSCAAALDNGLALTPPMGWLSWERFRCITDCKKYPNECISENLIKRTADLMISEGYLAAGYNYVGIDDCWLEKKRSEEGRMVPDRERFPSGMKALADYIHSKGLKFGMYEDYGNMTCGGYPGVLGSEELDIATFVEWEIDYLKLDGCYIKPEAMDEGYPNFGRLLNQTGRPIMYSCSWPAYQEPERILPNYASIAEHCNLWRNWDDIEDSWSSMAKIMDWFGDNQDRLAKFAGPGHWNDPDMLLIGNFGLSIDQARVQMAVWSILAAPLLMSVDLATIRPEFKEILLNKDIIDVDQDKMGKQGIRVWKNKENKLRKNLEIWKRELHDGSYAMAFVSQRDDGIPYPANFTFEEMSLKEQSYDIKDLYKDEADRILRPDEVFEVRINPLGVKFYKFIPRKSENNAQETEDIYKNRVIKDNKS